MGQAQTLPATAAGQTGAISGAQRGTGVPQHASPHSRSSWPSLDFRFPAADRGSYGERLWVQAVGCRVWGTRTRATTQLSLKSYPPSSFHAFTGSGRSPPAIPRQPHSQGTPTSTGGAWGRAGQTRPAASSRCQWVPAGQQERVLILPSSGKGSYRLLEARG